MVLFLDDGDLMVSFSNNIWVWGRELCKDGSVWLVLYVLRYFCGCYGFRYVLGFTVLHISWFLAVIHFFVHCLGSGGF